MTKKRQTNTIEVNQMETQQRKGAAAVIVMVLLGSVLLLGIATAEPDGASIIYVGNSTKDAAAPGSRTDDKGTITTLILNTVQQNLKWKAYVGNVTGTLVLKDSDDFSIYEWTSIAAPEGEVYISRDNTISWASLRCANATDIQTEETALNIVASAADSIVSTFSGSVHRSFSVAPIGTINQNQCRAIRTYVNGTAQAANPASLFQEVLLSDRTNLIYAALISQDTHAYRNNTKYDFQALVPDDAIASNANKVYYFYVEIA